MIGENIKKLRKDNKITQKQLADELNITIRTIQYYENGNRKPRKEILNKISTIFNIPMHNLLGPEKEKNEITDKLSWQELPKETQESNSIIGNNIALYRNKLGLTQKELAEKCLLSESAIKYYESNRRNPKIETLNKIAAILGIPLNYLINTSDKTNFIIKEKDITLFSTDELLAEIKRRIEL